MRATSINTDIYLFGGSNSSEACKMAYKYDTLTDTYTKLTNIPMEVASATITAIGTDIYLINGTYAFSNYNKQVYKYNTLTDTYTRLTDIPISVRTGSSVAIGTDIYLFGGDSDKQLLYKYNTLDDTYTRLTNIPYYFVYGSATLLGTDIYLFGSSDSNYIRYAYKYDTLTDTYTRLTDIPYDFYGGGAVTIGTNIYLFSGNYLCKVQVYSLISKTFQQDNLVVVGQGHNNGIGYETELFSSDKNVTAPLYVFTDAWFYTTNDGLITDIPTYYGNGTTWVNIKNLPLQNVVEEEVEE